MKKTSVCQHSNILFLISLPQTSDFSQEMPLVGECLEKLRKQNVEVRQHIWLSDLAETCRFDIVIIVAHYDSRNDGFVMGDGDFLPISTFVSALPQQFTGVFDISSCHSVTALDAIKRQCPGCRVQTALHTVPLLRRLIIYPTLAALLNHNPKMDYGKAFGLVSDKYDQFLKEAANDEDRHVPMVLLGDKMSSVFFPKQVEKNRPFVISVCLHTKDETQSEEVEAIKASSSRPTRLSLCNETLNNGDTIRVTLSFIAIGEEAANIMVKEGNQGWQSVLDREITRQVTIQEDIVREEFVVNVLSSFSPDNFVAKVRLTKDDSCLASKIFSFIVVEKMQLSYTSRKIEDECCSNDSYNTLVVYQRVYEFLYGKNSNQVEEIMKKQMSDDGKLQEVREKIFGNEHLLETIQKKFKKIKNTFNFVFSERILKEENCIFHDVPIQERGLLESYVPEDVKNNIESFFEEIKISVSNLGFLINKVLNERFTTSVNDFVCLESPFLETLTKIMSLKNHVGMLNAYLNLRYAVEEMPDYNDPGYRQIIKNKATAFMRYPAEKGVDSELYDILKENSATKTIIHNAASGISMPYLALAVAMALGQFSCSQEETHDVIWPKYIDCPRNTTTKRRIIKLLEMLNDAVVKEKIENYRLGTWEGGISLSAYLLQRIQVSIN